MSKQLKNSEGANVDRAEVERYVVEQFQNGTFFGTSRGIATDIIRHFNLALEFFGTIRGIVNKTHKQNVAGTLPQLAGGSGMPNR